MNIEDVKWVQVSSHRDERGSLSVIESNGGVPFDIKRVFYMHEVTPGGSRGGHAHLETDQFAIAIHGSMKIRVSDGVNSKVFFLDNPLWGIYLPRFTWTDLFDFSDGAVCLVLASTPYDQSKSIRSWLDYLRVRNISSAPLIEDSPEERHP